MAKPIKEKPVKKERAAKEKGKKSTRATKETRVYRVFELLCSCVEREDILQYAAAEWKVGVRTTDTYIAEARVHFKKNFDWDGERSKAVARAEMLFRRSMNIQDYRAALASHKDICLIFGLYAPTKLEHGGQGGGPIQLEVVYVNPPPTATAPEGPKKPGGTDA